VSELTLGGYMAKHERAAAFGGSDGQAYSVAVYVDEEPDVRGLYGAALLFVRWSSGGERPVGHVETETLALACEHRFDDFLRPRSFCNLRLPRDAEQSVAGLAKLT